MREHLGMNPTFVVDASVFVARFRRSEPGFIEASEFLRRVDLAQWKIYTPTIVQPELAGNIARTTGKLALARSALAILQRPNMEVVPIDTQMGNLAADLAMQYRIRGCDAVYVALAQVMNATLITLDKEQRGRVPSSVTARSPAEELALLPPLAL